MFLSLFRMVVVVLLLAFVVGCTHFGVSEEPEVWMTHLEPQQLVGEDADWATVGRELDVVQIYINALAYLIPQDDLEALVAELNERNIAIAIECGYFDWVSSTEDYLAAPNPKGITDRYRTEWDAPVGVETARMEIAKMAGLIKAGATPKYLNLDGPIRRMLHAGDVLGGRDGAGYRDMDRCMEELIAYMRVWREEFPEVEFFALTNFPNWGWRGEPSYWGTGPDGMNWGDYDPIARRIVEGCAQAGFPILGITVDNPFEYLIGTHMAGALHDPGYYDWLGRVLEVEALARDLGVEFNLIVNSEVGGVESGEAFSRASLAYLDLYRKAGGEPDRFILQSWYQNPKNVLPEDTPGTMTWLIKRALVRLRPESVR